MSSCNFLAALWNFEHPVRLSLKMHHWVEICRLIFLDLSYGSNCSVTWCIILQEVTTNVNCGNEFTLAFFVATLIKFECCLVSCVYIHLKLFKIMSNLRCEPFLILITALQLSFANNEKWSEYFNKATTNWPERNTEGRNKDGCGDIESSTIMDLRHKRKAHERFTTANL